MPHPTLKMAYIKLKKFKNNLESSQKFIGVLYILKKQKIPSTWLNCQKSNAFLVEELLILLKCKFHDCIFQILILQPVCEILPPFMFLWWVIARIEKSRHLTTFG